MYQKGNVLIVETDPLIRELLERWLREAGHQVIIGAPGTPAHEKTPSVVVANIASPQTAEQLIASLRADYQAPIVAISARFRRGLGASATAAHQLGVSKVLPKPFTREELLVAVREAIEDPP
jgi:DNA-binding response OmpR family regulator